MVLYNYLILLHVGSTSGHVVCFWIVFSLTVETKDGTVARFKNKTNTEDTMKKQLIIVTAALTLCFGTGLALAGTPSAAPQEEITIDGKKPARFSHPTHLNLGLDCAACHHDKEHSPLSAEAIGNLGDTVQLKCVTCHNSEFPNKDLQRAKDVFHARCQTCHKEGFAGKNGPTKCTGCHLKKKRYEGC